METSAKLWPPTGVSVSRVRNEPGPVLLPPVREHRIFVHASTATRSVCRQTGTQHLRRPGDIDIVPSGEEGGYDAAAACEVLVIRLAPRLLARVANEMGLRGGQYSLPLRHLLRDDRIVHLGRALEIDKLTAASGSSLYAESIGVALAVRLLGESPRTSPPQRGLSATQLQRLFDFVESHIDQPLTIDVLAREAGASSSHLRHWFKVATGTTLHRYVVRRRVERARYLIVQGGLSVSEIAFAVGFSHQSHLTRWMRRELGCTPRGLRSDSRRPGRE
jgi:AraC family transcriptional regulator